MNVVSSQTELALKESGLPQPEPEPGQFWHKTIFKGGTAEHTALCVLLKFGSQIVMQAIQPTWNYPGNSGFDEDAVFAPDLDYITAHLPPGFILEMWDGRHSCKIETEETTIRTMTDSFAEAAALVYLSLKQNAPGQTFVQPGDAEQE